MMCLKLTEIFQTIKLTEQFHRYILLLKFILHEFHRTSQFCPHLSIYRSGVYHFKKGGDHSFDGPGRYTRGIIGGCKELSGDRWQEQRDPRRNGKVAEESLSSFEYGAGIQRENRLLERRRGQE